MQSAVDVALSVFDVALWRTALVVLLTCVPTRPVAGQQHAEAVRQGAVRVFLDCASERDTDYLREGITVVNYVRDRADADVHVLVTAARTGADGTEFTLSFFGLGRFTDVNPTLRYTSPKTATESERRSGFLETFKRGLVRYVSDTPFADSISISFLPIVPVRGGRAADAWNLWVFNVNVSGSAGGERSSRGGSVRGSVSANRTTERWKMTLFTSTNYRADTFQLRAEERFKSTSSGLDGSVLLVKTLNSRWSSGMVATAASNTFLNYDSKTRIAAGLEYNVFPYTQSTRRLMTLQYTIGVDDIDYIEETIFGKTRERLTDHRIATSFSMQQPWGSGYAELAFSQFLNQPDKRSVAATADASVRLSRGLSLTISANATSTRDQIYLGRSTATVEEILVRQRQLATNYVYAATVGISYSFGSLFNNVVNPRFGGGGATTLPTF